MITEQQLRETAEALNKQYAAGEILPSRVVKGVEGCKALAEAFGYKLAIQPHPEAAALFQRNQPRQHDDQGADEDDEEYDPPEYEYEDDDDAAEEFADEEDEDEV